jgi:hypothetical protein
MPFAITRGNDCSGMLLAALVWRQFYHKPCLSTVFRIWGATACKLTDQKKSWFSFICREQGNLEGQIATSNLFGLRLRVSILGFSDHSLDSSHNKDPSMAEEQGSQQGNEDGRTHDWAHHDTKRGVKENLAANYNKARLPSPSHTINRPSIATATATACRRGQLRDGDGRSKDCGRRCHHGRTKLHTLRARKISDRRSVRERATLTSRVSFKSIIIQPRPPKLLNFANATVTFEFVPGWWLSTTVSSAPGTMDSLPKLTTLAVLPTLRLPAKMTVFAARSEHK